MMLNDDLPVAVEGPFAGDDWMTFIPWADATPRQIARALHEMTERHPNCVVIDAEQDEAGLYITLAPEPLTAVN